MNHYPINVDLRGRTVVVIGAAESAAARVPGLCEAGAVITIITQETEIDERLAHLADAGRVRIEDRPFQPGDLSGATICFVTVKDGAGSRAIVREARREKVLVSAVDRSGDSDFIVPSVVSRGDFTIAVSTGGSAPALAKRVRRELEKLFGQEYGGYVSLLRRLRARLMAEGRVDHVEALSRFVESDALALFAGGDRNALDLRIRECFGPGYRLSDLETSGW